MSAHISDISRTFLDETIYPTGKVKTSKHSQFFEAIKMLKSKESKIMKNKDQKI
jgi:hypothetical protein